MSGVYTDDISEASAPRSKYIHYDAAVSGRASPDESEEGLNSDDNAFIDDSTDLDGSGYDANKRNAPRGKTLPESPSQGKKLSTIDRGKVLTHDHGNNASSSDGEDVLLRALRPWIDPRLGRGKLRQGKQLTPTANTGNAGGTTKEDNSKNESRSSSPNGEEPGKSASSSGDGDEEVDTMDTSSNVEDGKEPGKSASSSDNEVDTKDSSSNVEEDSNVQWAAENADTASQGSISPDFGLVLKPNGLYPDQGEEKTYGYW